VAARTCLWKRVNVHLLSRGAGGVVLTASRRKMCGGWRGMTRAPVDEAKRRRNEERAGRALVMCIVEEEACFFF